MANKPKVYIYTFGCKVNQYESQQIIESFIKKGYFIAEHVNDCDIAVINSCTVTSQADSQCRNILRQIRKKNQKAKIILTGCYAKRAKETLAGLFPDMEVASKEEILSCDENHSSIENFSNHTRAFLKIQDGCDSFCSYCIVPFIRPNLYSKPIEEAVQEIEVLVKNGYPEIVLTGIHIGKYSYGLAKLLDELVKIQGCFRLRISSIEINEVNKKLLDLMSKYKEKICPHLHIPLQSASKEILRKMNRRYSPEEFSKKLKMIKQILPDAGITTDIIVGFPGETDKDFNDTLKFLKENDFSRLHVFRYSERPGTQAANFKGKVSPNTIKERAVILSELDKNIQEKFWRRFLGTSRLCVLEEGTGMLLTDNYVRLNSLKDPRNLCGINQFVIMEEKGQLFGKLAPDQTDR